MFAQGKVVLLPADQENSLILPGNKLLISFESRVTKHESRLSEDYPVVASAIIKILLKVC